MKKQPFRLRYSIQYLVKSITEGVQLEFIGVLQVHALSLASQSCRQAAKAVIMLKRFWRMIDMANRCDAITENKVNVWNFGKDGHIMSN